VPAHYVRINSSLGEATPLNIVVVVFFQKDQRSIPESKPAAEQLRRVSELELPTILGRNKKF
jgi:hypothetical protein